MLHGLLLTGGTSSRMGVDKATIEIGGISLGSRAASALRAVADPVLAVGPSFDTGLESVSDPSQGPLVAFVAGADALAARGCAGSIVMCACDVPLVDGAVLGILVDELDGHDAVIPVVSGRDQPTVSCYAPEAARVARELAASGARSLREWIARLDVRRLTAADWPGASFDETFTDVDTPKDLVRVTALVRDRR